MLGLMYNVHFLVVVINPVHNRGSYCTGDHWWAIPFGKMAMSVMLIIHFHEKFKGI